MKMRLRAVWTALGLILPIVIPAYAQDGNAARGHDLYLKYSCYACHGYSGQNGPGARLTPMKMTAAGFTAYVRSPRTRQMPSFSPKVLSDQQLADIHAYIKTLPTSKPAKDIPELQQFLQK